MMAIHTEFEEDSPSIARAGATRLRLWATKRILEAGLDTSVVDALLQQASPKLGERDGSGTGGAGGVQSCADSPLRPSRRRRAAAPPIATPSPMCCSIVGSADQNSSTGDTRAGIATEVGWSASSTAPSLREVEFLRDLQAFVDRFEHRCREELQAMHRLADNTMVSLARKVDAKLQTLEDAQAIAGDIASEHCGRVNARLQEVQEQSSCLRSEIEERFRIQESNLHQQHLQLESDLKAARTTAGDIAEKHCKYINAQMLEVQSLCIDAVEEHRAVFQRSLSERFQLQEGRMLQRCLHLESEQKAWRESLDDRCSALERRTLRLETRPPPPPTTTAPGPPLQELPQHPPHWLNDQRFETLRLELDARLKRLEQQLSKQAQDQTYTTQCLKEIAKLVADRMALADASCARVEAQCSSAEERLKQQFQEDSTKVAQDLEALRSGVAKLFDDAETILKDPLEIWKETRVGAGSCSSGAVHHGQSEPSTSRRRTSTGKGGPVGTRLSSVEEANADEVAMQEGSSESSGRPPSPPRPTISKTGKEKGQWGQRLSGRGQSPGLCGWEAQSTTERSLVPQQRGKSEEEQVANSARGREVLQRARSEPRLMVTQGSRAAGQNQPETEGKTEPPSRSKPDLDHRPQVLAHSSLEDQIPGLLSESPSLTPASSAPSLRRRSSEDMCTTGCWSLVAGDRTSSGTRRSLARNFSSLDVPPLLCNTTQADEDRRRKDRFVVSSEPPQPPDAWATPSRRADSRLRTSKLNPAWRMPSDRSLAATPVMRSSHFGPEDRFRVVQDPAVPSRNRSP
mmetsp:Transcript_30578/g.65928  ORF Transcript_30578/g.65928 Transcript_30578/m.65928 type:complete len:799 (-) Transcript_30578:136-2532(-)